MSRSGVSLARGQFFQDSTRGKVGGGGKMPRPRSVASTRATSNRKRPLMAPPHQMAARLLLRVIYWSQNVVTLNRTGIENLPKLQDRKEPWLVVLYAPWCPFCQAMEGSYVELAEKLAGSGVKVGKFRADRDQKEFAKQELKLKSFSTILFFPKHSSEPIKYPSEKRDVDSLTAFVNPLRSQNWKFDRIVQSARTRWSLCS